MWGLVGMALWASIAKVWHQHHRLHLLLALKESFQRLFSRPELWLASLVLFTAAISGLWSEDQHYWLERTRVRIPFFVLPWAFANLPRLTGRQYRLLLYILVWFMVILCVGVGINYFFNQTAILEGLSRGQPIPVPRNHIRFNLVLVLSIISGGWLWAERFFLKFSWERKVLAVAVVFLFVFIHFLSVRSGLVALYATLVFSIFRFIIKTRQWRTGLAALLILLLAPVIALLTMPSLQQRISYMIWDWEQYQNNIGDNYSDSERWISMHVGILIWKDHPVLGVGMGDLPAETQKKVRESFPNYTFEPKLPHNQFLHTLASTGLFGLCTLLIVLLYPIFGGRWARHYLFAAFQIIIFISFLVEYTLETSIGTAYYLFYWLWFMRIYEAEYES